MNWNSLTSVDQVAPLADYSHHVPVLIFKHSTRCSVSSIAKFRLEDGWSFSPNEMEPYYLDLIAYRDVSHAVAEKMGVQHESPQIILLWKGEVVLDASHLDISLEEIKEVLAVAA